MFNSIGIYYVILALGGGANRERERERGGGLPPTDENGYNTSLKLKIVPAEVLILYITLCIHSIYVCIAFMSTVISSANV